MVQGEGDTIMNAMADMEELAQDMMNADAVIAVRATTVGVPTPHGAKYRTTVIGTAVRLAPRDDAAHDASDRHA